MGFCFCLLAQANMKKKPEEEDTLDASVLSAVSKLDYVGDAERASYSESISARIRSEPYLASLCRHQPDYLHCAAAALASFGTEDKSAVVLGSRTQVMGGICNTGTRLVLYFTARKSALEFKIASP